MAKEYSISHSDIDVHTGNLYSTPKTQSMLHLEVIQNIVAHFGAGHRAVEIGHRIADITTYEQNTRLAHYYQFKTAVAYPLSERLLSADAHSEDIVEASLIDFDAVATVAKQGMNLAVYASGTKGLSSELGYVDQKADWAAAHGLDERMRALTTSEILAHAGIFLTHVHERDEALIRHSLRQVVSPDGSRGVSLLGLRKRAVADVLGSDGSKYEIIRRSGFYIDETQLTDSEVRAIVRASMLGKNKDDERKQILDDTIGPVIAEYVDNAAIRGEAKVLPVTSSYIVLDRFSKD